MKKVPNKPKPKDQPDVVPLLLDVKAVAALLSVGRSTIYLINDTVELGPMPIAFHHLPAVDVNSSIP